MLRRTPRAAVGGLALLLSAGPLAGCSDDPEFVTTDDEVCRQRRDGATYCIDKFEASREDATAADPGTDDESPPRSLPDRLPWTGLTWAAARAACETKGKRLCAFDEWIDACDGMIGDGGSIYAYGDERDESNEACNTGTGEPEPSGARLGCEAASGTFDQSGNVWEWSGNTRGAATARGGGYRSTQTHRCDSTLMNVSIDEERAEVGFRCCRDL